ncbi:L,D-transpeptidase family protein [Dongia sedimenti]|uniref:L,D-transpeptidase family protein n=1 Tax=Dongia sedimenti TaxID=3064282 RepID=A0ABU0YGG2_9PROT|nr:L,D-transpeptidase family protein [Rhodospirillaceae bacterium R-7]
MSHVTSIASEAGPAFPFPGLRRRPSPRLVVLCCAITFPLIGFLAFITLAGPAIAWFIGPVDKVLVDKSAKKLWLMRDGVRLYEADISLGKQPKGQKQREGDQRTPEGRYTLDWRDSGTDYHRAILISYPSKADQARGAAGGEIMIHGQKYFWRWFTKSPLTNGCIGVSNLAMDVIWWATALGTPIELRP